MNISVHEILLEQDAPVLSRRLLTLWWRRHTTRQHLRHALQDDPSRLSEDLGLSEAVLKQECHKWFWEN